MRHNWRLMAAALVCSAGLAASAEAQVVLTSAGDAVVALDRDARGSGYPNPNERPALALDNFDGFSGIGTKYLNFAGDNSGLIFTPGASVVKALQFTTANDADDRDPTSWALFGTNDPIASTDNSKGLGEAWTPIASGGVALPSGDAGRNSPGPLLPFGTNTTSYASYKLLFPTVRGGQGSIFQISDVQFFANADGSDTESIERPTQPVIAIADSPYSQSNHPGGEAPKFALDGLSNTKYLNFGKENTGIIVTLAGGPAAATGLRLTTANDAEERDPASYEIYGTNDPILSVNNGFGNGESWTLVSSGALSLPSGPGSREVTAPDVLFSNSDSYSSYRVIFPTVRNAGGANSMQIAEIALLGVPEPGTIVLAMLALVGGAFAARRRAA